MSAWIALGVGLLVFGATLASVLYLYALDKDDWFNDRR